MSTYAQQWIDTALFPLTRTRQLITSTNTIGTNTALLLGIAPRLIDVTKSVESEQLIKRLLAIINELMNIIQLPQIRVILLELYDILKSTQIQLLINDAGHLLLDALKLLQSNETNELIKQFETIATTLFGDYINSQHNNQGTAIHPNTVHSIGIWVELLHYLDQLKLCNLITTTEYRTLHQLTRQQHTELLIIYTGYGDNTISSSDEMVSDNTRCFVQFARDIIDEMK